MNTAQRCHVLSKRLWTRETGLTSIQWVGLSAIALVTIAIIVGIFAAGGSQEIQQAASTGTDRRIDCLYNNCQPWENDSSGPRSAAGAGVTGQGLMTAGDVAAVGPSSNIDTQGGIALAWDKSLSGLSQTANGILAGIGLLASLGLVVGSVRARRSSDGAGFLTGLVSAYQSGIFGDLFPRLLDAASTYINNVPVSLRGFVHEELWRSYHNANPIKVVRDGVAWLNPSRTTETWDGGITGLGGTTRIQLKSVDPSIQSLDNTINGYGRLSSGYGSHEKLLTTSEVADKVSAKASGNAGTSGVSNADASQVAETARKAVKGHPAAFLSLSVQTAAKAASRAGVIGAVISGVISTVVNVRDYARGKLDGYTAASRVMVDTVGGGLSAAAGAFVGSLAGAWAGAAAGAALGTIVPGAGNIVGAVVGFGVGLAVGLGAQKLWDAHVKKPSTNWISSQLKKVFPPANPNVSRHPHQGLEHR